MNFITALHFVEDKKPKVLLLSNPSGTTNLASLFSKQEAEKFAKQPGIDKVKFKTYEVWAKNWMYTNIDEGDEMAHPTKDQVVRFVEAMTKEERVELIAALLHSESMQEMKETILNEINKEHNG